MAWQEISEAAQVQLLEAIPRAWRIDTSKYKHPSDVTSVPRTCGVLTESQLRITELTATEIVEKIESRQLKAVQVLEAFAARAAIARQLVNCLTDWFFEYGLRQAQELDEALSRCGSLKGPLHGVPVALKDTYSVKGRRTTWGYVSKRDFLPDDESAIVEALRDAGAIIFCKTTMPQTGMTLETVSNLWGCTLNPLNTRLGAGGSSGGDAALVAMRGSPIAPSTDIGGSIRAPAAFNGLYGIRPTSDRIPKGGMESTKSGQISIKVSCGPVCHSIEDLRIFTKVINAYPFNRYDVTCTPVPWRDVPPIEGKLTLGLMRWDRAVMPHPPVRRALEHTRQILVSSGHEVIDFEPPFDCWELAQTTFSIYFQTGAKETLSTIHASGEPVVPGFALLLETYKARPLSAAEALQLNVKSRAYKEQFAAAWEATASRTSDGRLIDALICPPAPSGGFPHYFNVYWGYLSMFNLLDYPSTILPIPGFAISAEQDPVDSSYDPLTTNPYDKPNHDLYDPALYSNQPSTVQIVGRPFEDEDLIEVSRVIDQVLRDYEEEHRNE